MKDSAALYAKGRDIEDFESVITFDRRRPTTGKSPDYAGLEMVPQGAGFWRGKDFHLPPFSSFLIASSADMPAA